MADVEPGVDRDQGVVDDVRARLSAAAASADEERLKLLDELYRTLEDELEADLHRPRPAGH